MADVKVSTKATVTKKVIGNRTTETLIGSAAKKVSDGVKNLEDAFNLVKGIETLIEDGTLKVTNLEQQIEDLKQDFENKKHQSRFDLEMEFKKDGKEFAENYAVENGLTMVNDHEYKDTKEKLATLTTSMTEQIKAQVGKEVGMASNRLEQEKKIAEAESRAKEAEKSAEINQLKAENVFLKTQVESWKNALDSEREAGIKRAQAGSIQNLNLGSDGKR